MAAPAFFDVRREAARINRQVPELARKTVSLQEAQQRAREQEEAVEQLRIAFIQASGNLLRSSDRLIEALEGDGPDISEEYAALLIEVRESRRKAFADLSDVDPDHAWFWTEEWQRGERAVDRDIAAGLPMESGTPEEFLVALATISAQKE